MAEPVFATKQMLEQVFDGAADLYDRAGPSIFRQFAARLVEWMAMEPVLSGVEGPGARALDVATGKGAVLIPIAQRVGAVVGIDLSSAMLEEAERAARAAGIANYELRKMDAEHLEFPDASFDAVTCAFALFFFPAMDAALREMHRVCKPGGRIGISMWGKEPFGLAWKIFAEQVRAYGIEVRNPQRVAYTPEGVHALLAAAGFIDIETRSETTDVVYASEEDWWNFQLTLASRAAIYRMDDATRAQFKQEYLAKVRPFFQADGLHLPAPVIYAVANR